MKIIRLQQGTEEWLEFRLGKLSGSKLGKVYSRTAPSKADIIQFLEAKGVEYSPKETIPQLSDRLTREDWGVIKAMQAKKDGFYRLVAERVARPITPNDYADRLEGRPFSMMERGHVLEPEAIALFQEKTGKKVETGDIVWQSEADPSLIFSPDGSIFEGNKVVEAVEVKCPDSHVIIRAYDEQRYPSEYYEQVLQAFAVNEDLQRLYFVLYTDVMPALPIQIFTIERAEVAEDVATVIAYGKETVRRVEELAERLAF